MAVDLGVFERQKSVLDQQQLQEAFNLKKAAVMQEIASQQAKASEFDIGKVGEQAFIKASQGFPLSPIEQSSLQYLDAKSPTSVFNPVTGVMQEKPSLLQRANINLPQQAPQTAQSSATQPKFTQEQNKQMLDIFGEGNAPAQQVPLKDPNADYSAAMKAEMQAASGNPKLQQSIREKYVTTPEQVFTRENTLRDEFTNTTKEFRTVQDAFSKIKGTSDSAAGDLSLLYQYNKLLDPNSVVRESEFATVASSGSLGQRLQGAAQRLASGERLTPEQRTAFKEEAARIFDSQNQGYDRVKNTYKGLAERNRVNSANVITDYAAPVVLSTDKPAANGGWTIKVKQ